MSRGAGERRYTHDLDDHDDRTHPNVTLVVLALAHSHPYDLLIAAGLLGVGLAFAALGNRS